MTPTVSAARRIMAVLSPLLGKRATATATVRATGANVVLPRGMTAAPLQPSTAPGSTQKQIRRDKLVVTTEQKTITAAGVVVAVAAMMGGARYNELDAGTQIVWDPPIAGIETTSTLATDMTGGTDAAAEGAARRILFYETIGGAGLPLQLVAAQDFSVHPTIVVAWAGSPELRRTGVRQHQRRDRWEIYVVTSRLDGLHERAGEGLAILDLVEAYLTDRANVDGVCFSAPPARVVSRSRIDTSGAAYVYGLVLETQMGVRGIDPRIHTSDPAGDPADPPWSTWEKIKLDASHEELSVVDDATYELDEEA